MKMITAIINKRDSAFVCDALRDQQIPFTQVSTSGGFLRAGNLTLLIGVDDDLVSNVIEIIRARCTQRIESVPYSPINRGAVSALPNVVDVLVVGAKIFVTNVERFEQF